MCFFEVSGTKQKRSFSGSRKVVFGYYKAEEVVFGYKARTFIIYCFENAGAKLFWDRRTTGRRLVRHVNRGGVGVLGQFMNQADEGAEEESGSIK